MDFKLRKRKSNKNMSNIVIIDCGGDTCKFGFSTDKTPIVIKTLVGDLKVKDPTHWEVQSAIGNDAWDKRDVLELKCPIQKGIVTDWEAMEKIWRYIFEQLKVDPKICNVIYTAPLHPQGNREKLAETMFKNMNVAKLFICTQAYLVPYYTSYKYGVIVNSGESSTHIVPVINDVVDQRSAKRFELSGQDMSDYLKYLLRLNNDTLNDDDVYKFKENNCVVSQHEVDPLLIDIILKTTVNKCQISDNRTITVKDEMFKCPEAMFKPILAGREISGIHEVIYDCIKNCEDVEDEDRNKMRKNIILTGGNTMFPGFQDRLRNELKKHHENQTGNKCVYTVKRQENYQTLFWLGGAAISKEEFIENMFITKENYKENNAIFNY